MIRTPFTLLHALTDIPATHNNDLLDSDALNIVTRLSTAKVLRDGYFNLRCHLDPGCPDHLHPDAKEPNPAQPEEMIIGQAWAQLFPGDPIPPVLSQPCCSQFGLSKEKIREIPLATYERLRDWLLHTDLVDALAGRVFEYVWQKLFTGFDEWCPSENICYCDGYGICFGGPEPFYKWFADRKEWRLLQHDYLLLERHQKFLSGEIPDESKQVQAVLAEPQTETDGEKFLGLELQETRTKMGGLAEEMSGLQSVMDDARRGAFLRGNDARNRASEAGREWIEGMGF